jgi:putative phosphoesterase
MSRNIETMSSGAIAHVIGLVSDTHGLVRPSVHQALDGVEMILHAGDVGGYEVLHELCEIAPVHAVGGNTDPIGDPVLPPSIEMAIHGKRIHVSHGHEAGSPRPAKLLTLYDADVIVYGHTHTADVFESGGRLVINPGAAGPRRFNAVPSVARLTISGDLAEVVIVEID